jgi:hypothetical protein
MFPLVEPSSGNKSYTSSNATQFNKLTKYRLYYLKMALRDEICWATQDTNWLAADFATLSFGRKIPRFDLRIVNKEMNSASLH